MPRNTKGLKKGNPDQFFSKENQPTPEAKSEGKKRVKLLKDLAAMPVNDILFEKIKEVATMLGLEQDELNIEMAMHMKQVQIAVDLGDTKAYNAALDRLKGKPKQEVDVTTTEKGSLPIGNWLKK